MLSTCDDPSSLGHALCALSGGDNAPLFECAAIISTEGCAPQIVHADTVPTEAGAVLHTAMNADYDYGIGGENPMKFRRITMEHVAKTQKMEYTTKNTYCGERTGVGGTNRAKVRCDSFSRVQVKDLDGSYFGAVSSTLPWDQKWPPSLHRACTSANLADRADCMWWMKDQSGLMEVAADTTRQGIQRHTNDGGSCEWNDDWQGFHCNEGMDYVTIMIEDKVHTNEDVDAELGVGNDARLAGPIGFSQVCGFDQGSAAQCVATSGADMPGSFSDFLRGTSKPGLTDAENGDLGEGWKGREDVTNNFNTIAASHSTMAPSLYI